jgi:multisubunit Na+/H+ antiporter MnhB subunit
MISIVYALGSGLYYLLYRRDKSENAVKALTVRIGLSLGLFVLLLVAYAMGWLKPHSMFPITNTQTQKEITTPHLQNANTKPPLQNQSGAQE